MTPKVNKMPPNTPGKAVGKKFVKRPSNAMKSLKEDFNMCKTKEEILPKLPRELDIGLEIDSVFCDLQRISLIGCEIAERLVQNHQKRPCFKKIDLLCGRLKQDLTNSSNVVANINSQG